MNKKQKDALNYSKETREFIEQIIGGATHEINNHLFVIEGNSEMLEISEDKIKRSEFIYNIEEQTKKIAEVLKSLRSLIKDVDEDSESISTRWISDQVSEFCKTRFKNHHVFLKTNLPEHIYLEGKKQQIVQAFISVLNSSHEAVQNSRGSSKWVDLKIEEIGNELKIFISDSGQPLVDADKIIFDPDYNKNGRKGLPLVIAKDSFEKNGATFKHLKDTKHNTFEVSFKNYHKAKDGEMTAENSEESHQIPVLKLVS